MENSDVLVDERETPGARLRQAREAAGISSREMADRLKWLPAHVTAIEENRFDSLRNAAFVRGYLRAYARAVGLDEDELVAQYDAISPGRDREPAPDRAPSPGSLHGQKTGWSVVFGVVLAAAVIAAIWAQQRQSPEAGKPLSSPALKEPAVERGATAVVSRGASSAAADAAQAQAGAGVAPSPSEAVDTPVVTGEPVAAEAAPEETVMEEAAGEEAATEAAAPEEIGVEQAAAPGPVADSGVTDGEALLEFSFSDDCWLEVRDADGQLIYADLRRSGERLALGGKPPFNVLLGNSGAVSLSFRGEPVAVRTRPGRDTARFTVGEP